MSNCNPVSISMTVGCAEDVLIAKGIFLLRQVAWYPGTLDDQTPTIHGALSRMDCAQRKFLGRWTLLVHMPIQVYKLSLVV